jgi:hypothetical protein
MNKKLALLALCTLAPSVATAASIGVGASARSDEATVYLPIDLNPSLRIEPFFSFEKEEDTQGPTTFEVEQRELGVGGFFRMKATDKLAPYLGGRLSYVDIELSYRSAGLSGVDEQDGFRIEPTFGLEFLAIPHVALGLELFLFYEDLDGRTANGAVRERESMGNGTRLLLRVMP